MQVAKWGNSLALRLPAAVVRLLDLREGDEIDIRIAGAREMDVTRCERREELMARLRAHRGTLPEGFSFDRDEAHREDPERGAPERGASDRGGAHGR